MSSSMPTAFYCQPGMILDSVRIEKRSNCDGTPYFRATRPITQLFGMDAQGECEGIGRTQEEALQRLQADVDRLYDSLWE